VRGNIDIPQVYIVGEPFGTGSCYANIPLVVVAAHLIYCRLVGQGDGCIIKGPLDIQTSSWQGPSSLLPVELKCCPSPSVQFPFSILRWPTTVIVPQKKIPIVLSNDLLHYRAGHAARSVQKGTCRQYGLR